jgi:hypothetical protein
MTHVRTLAAQNPLSANVIPPGSDVYDPILYMTTAQAKTDRAVDPKVGRGLLGYKRFKPLFFFL